MTSLDLDTESLAILDKVKKLLALAAGGTTEGEASAATAKAMELLAAYNLDVAQLGTATNENGKRDYNHIKGGLYQWQRDVWRACADLNFCMYWSERGLAKGEKYQHRILGRKVNVLAAQQMAEYLQGAIERMAREWVKQTRPGASVFIKDAIIYREGMALRIESRLREERRRVMEEEEARQSKTASSGGTGIVLASVLQSEIDLNNDFLYGLAPGTTAAKRAEAAARREAARRDADAALRAQEAAEAADPALREARLRREAEARAESERWWADYQKKQERNAKRRKEVEPRENERVRRRRSGAFSAGYRAADSISLNKQVGGDTKKRID